jgi:hypothetical protein
MNPIGLPLNAADKSAFCIILCLGDFLFLPYRTHKAALVLQTILKVNFLQPYEYANCCGSGLDANGSNYTLQISHTSQKEAQLVL